MRVQVLQSFREGTVHVETAGPNTYSLRHHGGESGVTGYYSTPTLPATRSELALPPGNTMENLAQFQIPQGTRYLAGEVGPNFGHPGGGQQYVVTSLDHLNRVGG